MAKRVVKGHMKTKVTNYKVIDGVEVRPCLYYGKAVGHGRYMAAVRNNELIRDANGKPIPYKEL